MRMTDGSKQNNNDSNNPSSFKAGEKYSGSMKFIPEHSVLWSPGNVSGAGEEGRWYKAINFDISLAEGSTERPGLCGGKDKTDSKEEMQCLLLGKL